MMVLSQGREGKSRLLSSDCSADSDNSKPIEEVPKIGPLYPAALSPWENSPVSSGRQPKHFLLTHLPEFHL